MTGIRIQWFASVALLVASSTFVVCQPVQDDQQVIVGLGERLSLNATVVDCQSSSVMWKVEQNGVVMECNRGKVTIKETWRDGLQKVPGSCCSLSFPNASEKDANHNYILEIYDDSNDITAQTQFRVVLRDTRTTTTRTTTISSTPTTPPATLTTISPAPTRSSDLLIFTIIPAGLAVVIVLLAVGIAVFKWKKRSGQRYSPPPGNQKGFQLSITAL